MTLETPESAALSLVELAQAGRFAEIGELFVAQLRAMVNVEALRAGWEAGLAGIGPVSSVGPPVSEPAGPGVVTVKVPVRCEHGAFAVLVSVQEKGGVSAIQLAPLEAAEPAAPWQPPDYADQETFADQEMMLGSGTLAVPGTLSLPHQPGRLPAAVLLGGSGPTDRDETLGRNKPFKDLAFGLASRGVVVLRFDKVTFAHPDEVKQRQDFTVADEYLPAALAGIQVLQEHPAVDPRRIFVLGHSLGGTMAPRVAAADKVVAGLVILAGSLEPLHWAIVRQVQYLASLDPATQAGSESTIELLSQQVRRVDSPDLSPGTPSTELPMGVPAPYWLDLRAYDPVSSAKRLDRPVLLLQGGRDYQTPPSELGRWSLGLGGGPGVTTRVYPRDNHMFFAGTGRSAPAEYEPAQHVDPEVISDIASWISTIVPGRRL